MFFDKRHTAMLWTIQQLVLESLLYLCERRLRATAALRCWGAVTEPGLESLAL